MDKNSKVFLMLLNSYINKKELDVPLEDVNYNRIFSIASSHNLLPIILESAYRLNILQGIDKSYLDSIMQSSIRCITEQARRTYCFIDIYSYIVNKGVKPLILKGFVARSLYPDPDHRCSSDEDIFVRVEDYEKCHEAFMEKGFTVAKKSLSHTPFNAQEITYEAPDCNLHIEVHFNPFGMSLRKEMNDYFVSSFNRYIELDIDGYKVYSLCHTDHFIFLFLHMYKHLLNCGVGIRQIIDLLLYTKKYQSDIDWNHVLYVIKDMKGEKLLNCIFDIGKSELGITIGDLSIPFYMSSDINVKEALLTDILEGGVFGKVDSIRMYTGPFTQMATSNIKYRDKKGFYILKIMFPSYKYLKNGYPILNMSPLFLPFVWVKRFFKYLKKNKNGNVNKSIKLSKKRIKLFQELGIIE